MRFLLPPLALLFTGCAPDMPERHELYGYWGRVVDGEYDIIELDDQLDATGLREVRPAYRRWRYPMTDVPVALQGGRWVIVRDELIFNAAWAIDDTPTNQNQVWHIEEFTPIELTVVLPDQEEPTIFTTVSRLPSRSPSN
ncbi:MAG: hypothetical protein EA397_00905 [Deltaproteobacteria bacterium]|nr:MAG: hypothetical protein EA397_00905 [Deltaproteobacteria bacterium]